MGRGLICTLFFVLSMNTPAFAVLGGSVNTLAEDQVALKSSGRIQKTSQRLYSVHEIENESLRLKEFVSQDGVIFAISWSGTRHPELESLLGSYLPEFQAEDSITPMIRGERKRTIRTERLQVQTWGHPRHLQGIALDPNLIPEGVNPRELR